MVVTLSSSECSLGLHKNSLSMPKQVLHLLDALFVEKISNQVEVILKNYGIFTSCCLIKASK